MRPFIQHIFLTTLLTAVLAGGVGAQRPTEHQIKAAVVLKFGRFVEWPAGTFADSSSPMTIAVHGRDAIGQLLEEMIPDLTGNIRPVQVVRVERLEDLPTCHILFISASENRRLAGILATLGDRSVLTVGDMEWFARGGGMIRLRFDDERMRMRVNLKAARDADLRISSRLLHLAEIVGEQDR